MLCASPCSGISRKERWLRADKFGLNPPQYILEILNEVETRISEGKGKKLRCDAGEQINGAAPIRVDGVNTRSMWDNLASRILEEEGALPS